MAEYEVEWTEHAALRALQRGIDYVRVEKLVLQKDPCLKGDGDYRVELDQLEIHYRCAGQRVRIDRVYRGL